MVEFFKQQSLKLDFQKTEKMSSEFFLLFAEKARGLWRQFEKIVRTKTHLATSHREQ